MEIKEQFDFRKLGRTIIKEKGSTFLNQGEVCTSLFFVEAGLIKAVYSTADGKEMIKSFFQAGDLVGSLRSCVLGQSSLFSLICIEETSMVEVEFVKLRTLMQNDLAVAQQAISILTNFALKKEQREYEFLCLSAEERLQALTERSPEFLNRVKQQDLARYLGISPEALSRIRARR